MKMAVDKRLLVCVLTYILVFVPGAYAESNIDYAWVYSENRQYDPNYYTLPPNHPLYNGAIFWFMMGLTNTSGNLTHPVYFDSNVTGNYEMFYNGTWGPFSDFSIGAFTDVASTTWGGPFPSPGSVWENKTYTFTVDNTTADWTIPSGSLRQIDIPQVTISGTVNPYLFWNPIEGADYYQLAILPIDQYGQPDTLHPLFVDLNIYNNYYTYDGDIFSDGNSYGIWLRAVEKHPYSDLSHEFYDPKYDNDYVYLNRASFVTQHTAPVPEPTTMLLVGSGLIGLAGVRRRFRK